MTSFTDDSDMELVTDDSDAFGPFPEISKKPPVISKTYDLRNEVNFDLPFTPAPADIMAKVEEIFQSLGEHLERNKHHPPLISIQAASWDYYEDGIPVLKLARESNATLYVRTCYNDLYKILDDKWRGQKDSWGRNRSAWILGAEGSDKTCFSLVLAKLLMQRKKPILLFFRNTEYSPCPHFFWQGEVFYIVEDYIADLIEKFISKSVFSKLSHEEDNVELWSIADSCFPLRNGFINQICISSPAPAPEIGNSNNSPKAMRSSTHRSFGNSGGERTDYGTRLKNFIENTFAEKLILPPCNWKELQRIRLVKYGDPSKAESQCPISPLQENFALWGGVVGTLLDPTRMRKVEKEFQEMKVSNAVAAMKTGTIYYQPYSGAIFPLANKYSKYGKKVSLLKRYQSNSLRRWWATPIMERKAWIHFVQTQEADVIKFMERSCGTCRNDIAFEEELSHLILTTGLQGSCWNLETGEEKLDMIVKATTAKYFSKISEIDNSAEYWRPDTSGTSEFCHGYMPAAGILIQLGENDRDIKFSFPVVERALESGIFTEWRDKNPGQSIRLLFLLDTDHSERFREQTFRCSEVKGESKSERKTLKERKLWVESCITQYLLEVDLKKRLAELGEELPKHKRFKCILEE